MNSALDLANLLSGKIWFTRKAWIIAESRMLSNELHTQFLMVVYSIYSVCLAVIFLKFSILEKDIADIFSVNISVVLLGLALYLNTRTFKDRARQFKYGYIKLDDIDNKLQQLHLMTTQDAMVAEYNNQFLRYNVLLGEVENHLEFDDLYARYRAGSGLTSRKLTKLDYLKIFLVRAWRFLFLTIFYAGPVFAFLTMVFSKSPSA